MSHDNAIVNSDVYLANSLPVRSGGHLAKKQ
jgi:hypothetical protein